MPAPVRGASQPAGENRASYDEFKKRGGTIVPLVFVDDKKFDGFNGFALDFALR